MSKCLIHSIFLSSEGEGVFLGTPQVFVRFQGCHARCLNCDTKDSWDFDPKKEKPLEQVVLEIEKYNIRRVSITGGDPLDSYHRDHVLKLALYLRKKNYFINIEVSGLEIDPEIFSHVNFISMDFKTPSSKIKSDPSLILEMAQDYFDKVQIKSVIETKEDFDYVYNVRKHVLSLPWVLTPAYNLSEEFPMERFQKVLKLNEENGGLFRVIGQQHKWIYGNDSKVMK